MNTRPGSRRGLAALLLLASITIARPAPAAPPLPPLPALGADLGQLTVSGISSGGYMAVQFQVAHSRLVRGAGVLAGGPYDCANGSAWRALTRCMSPSSWAPLPSVGELRARTEALARSGRIDPPDDLRDDRVWLLSGDRDETVRTAVVEQLAAFYGEWLPPTAIRFVRVPEAAHAMISIADPQANTCSSTASPYINRCGDLDPAGEMLRHMLGPLQPPAADSSGEVLAFDQGAFAAGRPIDSGLADEAYLYVPKACRESSCRLHVAFHGCRQSAAQIGRRFVDGAGYNRWADSNRLLVLYPQTVPRHGPAIGSWKWISNPFACWDWWGYTGSDYPTRDGLQISAVRSMLERLAAPRQP
ncbi:MAG TPA: poly(3-hydroxybutyrate) depolymerase [Candidatus Accumulibacter phosphatis]|nr:MAG: esterase, PHB depolymerase family [Candidatus Accumulibacter sp. SK-11]HAY29099.1 poly(3-hydroxybutyrate) depolymerase [Accumulibacter sp.]HRL77574.1 poly(3-hydroxybutyrate) depolymerase [Candidatus Accumulibacter phosphatis]HCN69165.1 poly(3-hydroxybutyrate) depolymerase [Accumulibacter sp.]HCV12643.1 poly(3-hydroxybutyrate) depolymerase [Accumulibacter sp.]